MKIGYKVYKYAPENFTLQFNHKAVSYNIIKRLNIDSYQLYISKNKTRHIRDILKGNKNYNKPALVTFTNGKSRTMLNNANSLKAIKRIGWTLKSVDIL